MQTRAVQRRQKIQIILLSSVWLLLVIALAKPVEVREPARDLLVEVDLSGSMSEQDFAPQG